MLLVASDPYASVDDLERDVHLVIVPQRSVSLQDH